MGIPTAQILSLIYGDAGAEVDARLEAVINRYREHVCAPAGFRPGELPFDERDSILITYGDAFRRHGEPPLGTLLRFLDEEAEGVVSGVHVLPFSPSSSDDGFSVIDYRQVDPELGDWEHIAGIGGEFALMVDLVLNHCSAEGPWFQAFLADEEPYNRFFLTADPKADLSQVVRARVHPLLTGFRTARGIRHLWTTFSADQVDLDYGNPEVLLEMVDVFLGCIARGARIIRLDAVAYLWKEVGTPCFHHHKAHAVVRLLRAIVDEVAPWVVIVTETNAPHEENVSYFGSGRDEAHLVYNFALPPLTLDAFLRQDTGRLREWAATLATPGTTTAFLNFLASHDGIGLLPAEDVLGREEIDSMIRTVKARGGMVGSRTTPSGEMPYELNVSYLSAIAPHALPDSRRAAMFLAAQSIKLALAGVPAIYCHSLIGSDNWIDGAVATGCNRAINRRKHDLDELSSELAETGTLRNLVFEGHKAMLRARAASPAFRPTAPQRILWTPKEVLAVLRECAAVDGASGPSERVLCLVNVSDDLATASFTDGELGLGEEKGFRDLLTGDYVFPSRDDGNRVSLELDPYEVLWLRHR